MKFSNKGDVNELAEKEHSWIRNRGLYLNQLVLIKKVSDGGSLLDTHDVMSVNTMVSIRMVRYIHV